MAISFSFSVVLTTDPHHKFKIKISTEEFNAETEENGLSCNLVFTYTEKYPDTAPLVELEDTVNLEDDHETGLLEHIQETVTIFDRFLLGHWRLIRCLFFLL